ncbi:2-oxoacid:acceptor oxidoreductase subunit alpha [Alphaproteobacteria bacterium]|nr:2-oxoacid:acceptor oxidoreductase subunit alpha [Alphaproteobacteria bacterium]
MIRFAGDSGDGIQLLGGQTAMSSALMGNDFATFPDYPAEIRAPKGTSAGVSGFQIQIAAKEISTPGDKIDILVALNPAALSANLEHLKPGGTIIVDVDAFDNRGLRTAKLDQNPLRDGSLAQFNLVEAPVTSQTRLAAKEVGVSHKVATRSRNFFAMGILFWLYSRSLEPALEYISGKFSEDVASANEAALRSGWNFGETTEALARSFHIPPTKARPGIYRNVTGNEALAYGLVTAAHLSGRELFYGAYPITPASDILHKVSRLSDCGARTFQAEDEIAAICAAIGASFGGAMGATGSSGPGIALKTEAIGYAVMLEQPLLIVNVQRGGPSTGLPTKVEQTDLLQAVMGRNGEAPLPVLAASGPADCFYTVIEAWRLACKLMTPVMVLSDAYTANGAEPWSIPDIASIEAIDVEHPTTAPEDEAFKPYSRDEWLARPWALPGTPGLTHRIGGIEKEDGSGNISYDPLNHEKMVHLRASKVEQAQKLYPVSTTFGQESGGLLIISWGGTFGPCREAVTQAQSDGLAVSHLHLRHLNPLPSDLGDILKRFKTVVAAELNKGQLRQLLRAEFLFDVKGLNKIRGEPFLVNDIQACINSFVKQEG